MIMRKCEICGETLKSKGSRTKYCPGECKRKALREAWRKKAGANAFAWATPRECVICGKLFVPKVARAKVCRNIECIARNRHGNRPASGKRIKKTVCTEHVDTSIVVDYSPHNLRFKNAG